MDLFLTCLVGFVLVCGALVVLTACLAFYLLPVPFVFSRYSLRGKHVLVTGGSKGIGRALAIEFVKCGCHVTIVARNQDALHDACRDLKTSAVDPTNQCIHGYSVDVTTDDFSQIQDVFRGAQIAAGNRPVDILINNAGGSAQGHFEELPLEAFEAQMRLNYLSAVYFTRAWFETVKDLPLALPKRVVFISSQAGQLGVYGYTAYSPTKFALRGFAEVLQAELKPYNVAVTVAFPPNTETEGYQEEVKTMPLETQLISGAAGLLTPQQVAGCILRDVCAGNFTSHIGMDGWMLAKLTAGFSPVTSVIEAMQEIWLAGVFRVVALFYLRAFDAIIAKCKKERNGH